MYIYIYIYVYIYRYIHIHIYIYSYIYIDTYIFNIYPAAIPPVVICPAVLFCFNIRLL